MKKVYAVLFITESGDQYQAVFKNEPTDGHLTAYVKKNFPDEIYQHEGKKSLLISWDITETPIEELPEPIMPIPHV